MTNPVDDEEFTLPPEDGSKGKSRYDFDGEFDVEITDIAIGVAKSGNPKFVVTQVGLEGAADGLQFTSHLPEYKMRELLAVLGDKTPKEDALIFQKSKTVGKVLKATFVADEYQGKRSAKIEGYAAASSSSSTPLPF